MSVLPSDSSLKLPSVSVLKASAGSGKTYTLTQRYVQFALSRAVPKNSLPSILAITFSNTASREMKESVLEWLKLLCFRDAERTAAMSSIVAGGAELVRKEAEARIEEILTRYSDFQVRTIDSFMSTVFRAAALDFGFNPEFEILLEPAPLMEYAFGLFVREAVEGSRQAAILDGTIASVLGFQGEGDRFPWDPARSLLERVKRIDARIGMLEGEVSSVDFSTGLRKAAAAVRERLEEIDGLVRTSGLEPSGGSSFSGALEAARAGRYRELISKGFSRCPVKKPKSSADAPAYAEILERWEEVDGLVSAYAALWARASYQPYLGLHQALDSTMERVKKSQGKIFISDISRMLGRYLDEEIVPDIYFRLGERIFHFLIDEFQDTSPIQWRNLFPLIENSLSVGGSLFVVGDTKQAIYGFRDADFRIMKRLEEENPFPSAGHAVKELSTNFRSRAEILRFAKAVFLKSLPASPHRAAGEASGLSGWTQDAREDGDRGYVELRALARNDDEPPERETLHSIMRELAGRGYRWADIAVLAPRNDDVVRAASWLNEAGIPFLSYSSLDVRKRRSAAEVISLLTFLDSPPDDLAFTGFILGEIFARCLEREGWKSAVPLHGLLFGKRAEKPFYKVFQKAFPELWEKYFSGLFRSAGYLPLYDLATEIYSVFDLFSLVPEEEATLAKLLEAVKGFEGSGSNSLRDFLSQAGDSASEDGTWDIDIPRGADCVSLMTVHKAKGLGFPVVIVILYGEKSKPFEYTVVEENGAVTLVKLTKDIAGRDAFLGALYDTEKEKDKVDYLNSLYVALTRAKGEMYVLAVARDGEDLPFTLLPESGFEPKEAKGDARPGKAAAVVEAPLAHEARPIRPSAERGRLSISERKRGELVHRILSLITWIDGGVEEAVARAAGRASAEARGAPIPGNTLESIARTLRDPALRDLFTAREGRTVENERELCDGEGRLFRTDRLVIDPERVTVIDFKTGKEEGEEPAHREQILSYRKILREVYPGRVVEAVLVYTDRAVVRRVE